MFKKGLAVFLAVMMAGAAMTGCGSVKTDSQVEADKSSGDSGTSTAAASFRPAKDPYTDEIKIAFLPNVIGDSCAAAWSAGMEEYLSAFDNVTFQTFDGKASVDTEVQIMDDLINQKYDAILLQATDAAGLAASTQKAEAAGIPVITVNLDADTPHAALVAGVDVEAGKSIAKAMGDSMGGKGKVVIIQATPGATKGENVNKGFKEVMKSDYPDIEILDEQTAEWLTEKANTVMNDFLTKYPEIDGVLCHNDAMAEGAAQAAQAAGRLDQMQIWGVDGEAKMLEYIEQGLCTGTVYTNAKSQGAACAQMALFMIGSGVDSSKFEKTPVIKMAPVIVTKENVGTITEDMRW